jgi:hypothetical protein
MSGGRLTFAIPGRSGVAVPVRVSDARGTGLREVLSTAVVEGLTAGTYFISALLPDGTPLSAAAEVSAGGTTNALLEPETADGGPQARDAVADSGAAASLGFDVAPASSRESPSANPPRRATSALRRVAPGKTRGIGFAPEASLAPEEARVFTGNPLGGEIETRSIAPDDGSKSWTFEGEDAPQWLEVATGRPVDLYVAVPAGMSRGGKKISCTVTIGPSPDFEVTVRLQNPEADAVLRYAGSGMRRQARALGANAWTEEQLLREKFADPIAAAVGAYALLRLGEIDRLHDWSHNLVDAAPWMPDGLVILGEHLALDGRHEEAAKTFLRLPERGLPIFSEGLSKAIGRLRLYASALPKTLTERAGDLRDRLQAYASVCEFANPLTNFTGHGPREPRLR